MKKTRLMNWIDGELEADPDLARAVEDLVAEQVGHRHFGRGNGEERIVAEGVHVLLELRQLPRADHRVAVDEERREHFRVTVLARVQVEQEIDQPAFQPRPGALVENEPAAGNRIAGAQKD